MSSTIIVIVIAMVLFCFGFIALKIGKKYNKTDWGHPGINILDGINTWLCRTYHRLPDELIEIPQIGPALLVSNHISGLDPLLLIAATNRPLRFMIAQEEFDRWWLKWLLIRVGCIPVKRNRNPTKAFKESISVLDKGEIVVVFPQGGIVNYRENKPLKKGAFILAKLTQVPLLCFRIDGVRASGSTLVAIFIRSRVRLSSAINTSTITDENLTEVMHKTASFLKN